MEYTAILLHFALWCSWERKLHDVHGGLWVGREELLVASFRAMVMYLKCNTVPYYFGTYGFELAHNWC